MEQKSITFIGGGNMAQAIVFGLLKQGYARHLITVCDPNEYQRAVFLAKGINATDNNQQAVQTADVVLLAVKPQIMALACESLSAVDFSGKLVISIAAGISISRLQALLPTAQQIVRVMPNTSVFVSEGMAGLYADQHLSTKNHQFATALLQAVGQTVWVAQESDMHWVTAAAGSSPAYFFRFMEAMQEVLLKQGLSSETARLLVQQSALGAARMVICNPETPIATLRENVTSKGGTTAAALAVFEQADLAAIIEQAMQACVERSMEMETLF
ncbi:pyrroline-5-carboxylate reductase [Cricetibacter osteomyelitidis]|nr:pyrroline-5-carboxylate reductase [Cricetibacter osteomyelitidis]